MLFTVYKSHFFLERPTQRRALRRSLDYSWEQKAIFSLPLAQSSQLKGTCVVVIIATLTEALNMPCT